MDKKKVIRSTCKGCHGGCGVLVTIEKGAITYIEGDPDSNTRGTMCGKGLAAIQHIDHPDRLLCPLKRNGQRGDGEWERIGWDEALETITGNVERPGGMVNWVHPATGPMLAFAFEIADNIPQENREKAIGADKHRYMDFGRCHTETVLKQLREGQCDVKMLHQHGGNFLFSLANTHNVRKALLNLEFISVADQFMSTMAEIADIVLPVAHWLEEDDLWNTHPAQIKQKVPRGTSFWKDPLTFGLLFPSQ